MIRLYRRPALSEAATESILAEAQRFGIRNLQSEWCFNVEVSGRLNNRELSILAWLLGETFEPENIEATSFLQDCRDVVEVGPRLNFETAYSSIATRICHDCGLTKVMRVERSRRFGLDVVLPSGKVDAFLALLHDRMTEMRYFKPPRTFRSSERPESVYTIPVLREGAQAILRVGPKLGLSLDEQDASHLVGIARDLKRDLTNDEVFKYGQVVSDHSRHWSFRAVYYIDGVLEPQSLMEIVQEPLKWNPGNSRLGFGDNASATVGRVMQMIQLADPRTPGRFVVVAEMYHRTLKAETHNHPSGIEPFEGGATGLGGILRDVKAPGRGGLTGACGSGYATANLHIPGHKLPWEEDGFSHPENLASPLDILIRASDGCFEYGNAYGRPTILGFVRTFGQETPDGYRAWFKPIVYVECSGKVSERHVEKRKPEKGMLIVQIGGPGYRIGVGGGTGSSLGSGENEAELDFKSVQRGDPQMGNRAERAVRGCVELGEENPLEAITDVGAGGLYNALSEIASPAGAVINVRDIPAGDPTLSTLEIGGNESQERFVALVWEKNFLVVAAIAEREGVPCQIIGRVTGDGNIVFQDSSDGTTPVNLPLDRILENLPRKTFNHVRVNPRLRPLSLHGRVTVASALERVLRLPSVGSKQFLTRKVDRSVGGLVVRQQCCGPNHLPVSDFAITADDFFSETGELLSIGEQPIIGLISPEAQSRMSVGEMLLNVAGALITTLGDVKVQANWMWAGKLPGEVARMFAAAKAGRDIMIKLGIAIDGGKDSMSMSSQGVDPDGQIVPRVKAPGQLVFAGRAPMEDTSRHVTPDFKEVGNRIGFIDLSRGKMRLGGSALAQVYRQLGDECPDAEDADLLLRAFQAVQELLARNLIASYHDRSDGGLIISLLEMAFAGNLGFDVSSLQKKSTPIEFYFNQELGAVIECEPKDATAVSETFEKYDVPFELIGVVRESRVVAVFNHEQVLDEDMVELRGVWESTSSAIDRHQANPGCVAAETRNTVRLLTPPRYYWPEQYLLDKPEELPFYQVAVLRDEGSNSDREMAAALMFSGFDPVDVAMSDLLKGKISLDGFRGIIPVGGFSRRDVLDAAKGWAGIIRFNPRVREEFERFFNRPNTFSLGVCNGAQLSMLMGWMPNLARQEERLARFIRNRSERFESRFAAVRIIESPSIFFRGMEGWTLGIWVAHGEGRYHADPDITEEVVRQGLAPVRYAGPYGEIAEQYPFNPNGSPHGIAAVCDPEGRHLAIMPHPERSFLRRQWPWLPRDLVMERRSPWLRMFQNVREWCATM